MPGRSGSYACAGAELCCVLSRSGEKWEVREGAGVEPRRSWKAGAGRSLGLGRREGQNWKEVCWMLLTCSVLTGGADYIGIRQKTKGGKTGGFSRKLEIKKEMKKKMEGKKGWAKSRIEDHKDKCSPNR